MPVQSQAAQEMGFAVDIAVIDDSCGEHISSIRIPQVAIKFRLSPEVTNFPNDNRYNSARANFPEGNATQDTKVIEYEVISDIVTSDINGVNSLFIKLSDIPELKDGTALWGQYGKAYRYNIEMVGIYRTDNDDVSPTVARSRNYINDGNYYSGPKSPKILGDIYIDYSGKISSSTFWDESASEKTAGFVKNDSDSSECVKYHVMDFELSTDYIGKYSNSIAGKITYEVVFEHIPDFLTDNYAYREWGGLFIKDAISFNNKDSWTVYTLPWREYIDGKYIYWKHISGSYGTDPDTAPTDKEAGVIGANGALSDNDKIIFTGLPLEGKNGKTINVNTYINIDNVTDLAGNDARDIYKDYIFYAQNVGRIDKSITTLDKFFQHEFADKYDNIKKRVDVITRPAPQPDIINVYYFQSKNIFLPLIHENGTINNTFRYVIFDPDELVIVGVVLNILPGIIAIMVSIVALITAIAISRKRGRERIS